MPRQFILPAFGPGRGPGFWTRLRNLWPGRRRVFRTDFSNEWRYEYLRQLGTPPPPPGYPSDPAARTRPYSWLVDSNLPGRPGNDPRLRFSAVILGDTGEGDASQHTLLPLIRALDPDFLIINGDVAYPAGNADDFVEGFFKPYRDLRIPVWAVPGNHEYYSDGKGKEFFEVFCSRMRGAEWARHGLVPKPQPGSYWELAEEGIPLVILGVDSGQTGGLDGSPGVLGLLRRAPDGDQHKWLEWRLQRAEQRKDRVILLFHIPKLVKESDSGVGLKQLHALISRYRCIKLVVTAHVHNMQWYSPGIFTGYLAGLTGPAPVVAADYVVSGCGGATVESPRCNGPFKMTRPYPPAADYDAIAGIGERAVGRVPLLGKTMLGDAIAALGDADHMGLQSLLHLEYEPAAGISVTPYYVKDLAALYQALPANAAVDVQKGQPPLSAPDVQACKVQPSLVF